jgi:hypothetical protein
MKRHTSSRLDPMPGVARPTAAMLVAALGTELRRVPRAAHVASWAGVSPGHHERAGQHTSGKTRQGHRCWRTVWGQAAHAAARTTRPSCSAPYRRRAIRRGKKRAMRAVAHAMLSMADARIQRQEPYREAGADCLDRLQPDDPARRLGKRLEQLGYGVTLQSPSTDAIPERRRLFSRQLRMPRGAPSDMKMALGNSGGLQLIFNGVAEYHLRQCGMKPTRGKGVTPQM